jgi:uncharacterized protein YneF (UPF0154 family)
MDAMSITIVVVATIFIIGGIFIARYAEKVSYKMQEDSKDDNKKKSKQI